MKIFSIFIFVLQFFVLNSEECQIDVPIKKDNECLLTYCTYSEFENRKCIKNNNIIETQWLNNIILISENPSSYINSLINSKGDLIITSNKYSSETSNEYFKERVFYGLNSNGHPLFFDFEKNTFISKKFLYFDTSVYKDNFEVSNIIIDNEEYYLSFCSNGSIELYDLKGDKAYYKPIDSFLNGKNFSNSRFFLKKSPNDNENFLGFTEDFSKRIYLINFKINSVNLDNNEITSFYNETEFAMRNKEMISCIIIDINKIMCSTLEYIINNDIIFYYEKIYLTDLDYDNLKSNQKYIASNYYILEYPDNKYRFHKLINLNDNIKILCGYKVKNPINSISGVGVFIIILRYNNGQITQVLFQYIFKNYYFKEEPSLCDLITINDNRIAYITVNKELKELYISIFELIETESYMNVKIRIYMIPLSLYNLHAYNSIRGITFKNFLGITFSGTKSTEIDASTYFILLSYINSTDPIGIKNIFNNKEIYELELSKYINNSLIENNLFGYELVGVKILYFYDISQSGIFLLSRNKETQININDTLSISDIIQLKINSSQGASFGKYYLEFAGVMQEPSSYDELKKYARSYQYLKQNLNQDS